MSIREMNAENICSQQYADICRALATEYGDELATIEEDARRFLRDLEAQGILVNG